jgi:small GTP-binding protein
VIKKQKKIILIGNFSVGKTSLIRRFVENSFSDKYISTIGMKISKKEIQIKDEILMLLIWDIEGAVNKVKRVNKTYMRGASGVIIVSDISSSTDIKNDIMIHLDDFYSVNKEDIPAIVAFNKFDKNENFKLDISDVFSKYPSLVGEFNTSAKDSLNVENMFMLLSKEMLK